MKKTFMALLGTIFILAAPKIGAAADLEALSRLSMWQIHVLSFSISFILNMIILYLISKFSDGVFIEDLFSLLYATLVFTVSCFVISFVLKPLGILGVVLILGFVLSIVTNGAALFITTRIVPGFRIQGSQYYVSLAIGIALLNILIGVITGLFAMAMLMP